MYRAEDVAFAFDYVLGFFILWSSLFSWLTKKGATLQSVGDIHHPSHMSYRLLGSSLN